MGFFSKKKEPEYKYRVGQCIVWRQGRDIQAYGVVVRFKNDLMLVDIRESSSRVLTPGVSHWFTIEDRDWSDK